MPGDGTSEQDLFRQWRDMSQAFLEHEPLGEQLRAQCETLFTAWTGFARTWTGAEASAPGGPFDPVGWMDAGGAGGFGDLWRWFGDASSAGDPWQAGRDMLQASEPWRAYGAALERYNAVMGAAWLRAFGAFAGGLAADAAANPPDWTAIQARWQQAADAELAAAQRSEAFLAAQRDLIRARLDCSALLRRRVEALATLTGLPTRAEVDDLHQSVHALTRELRELRARLDAVSGPAR